MLLVFCGDTKKLLVLAMFVLSGAGFPDNGSTGSGEERIEAKYKVNEWRDYFKVPKKSLDLVVKGLSFTVKTFDLERLKLIICIL